MGRLGDSTSYGTDGVTAGMLRALPWAAKRHLAGLMDAVTPEAVPVHWAENELVAIGKDKVKAPGAHQLRYLGLGSLSHKLFASGVLAALPPVPLWHVGFTPGQSPHDLVGILRAGLYDAAIWQDPALACVVLSCDVERAFDSIEHDVLAAALLKHGVPPAITELLMLPLLRGRALVRGSHDPVDTQRGKRTGGVESPYNLNAVLAYATADLVSGWQRDGRGWGGEHRVSLWWWADNAFLLARTVPEAFELFGELTGALRGAGLRWKPASLELCTGGDGRPAEEGTRIGEAATQVGDVTYNFVERTHIRVLGPVLPARARQRDEVEQAVNAANGRWHARRSLWRCRFLGRGEKLRRFYSDVCGALVEQAGGWHLTQRVVEQITTWERDRLRTLIGMRPREEGEAADDFWRAFERRLNAVCAQTGARRLAERVVTAYARRGIRMATAAPGSASAAALETMLRNRQCAWRAYAEIMFALDPQNALRWRHKRAGRPPAEWEDLFVRAVGENWVDQSRTEPPNHFVSRVVPAMLTSLSLPKVRRRVEERPQVHPEQAGETGVVPVAPLQSREWPVGSAGVVCAFVDARWLADAFCGAARSPQTELLSGWWRQALRTAEELWAAGVRWHERGPVQWVPRRLNAVADWLVQAATHGPVSFFAEQVDFGAKGAFPARMRVFSDGGLTPDVPARWGAAIFLEIDGRLRLVAAAADWAEQQTVPAAELEGALQAWLLARRVFGCMRSVGPDTPAQEVVGRPLTGAERGQLEVWAELVWASAVPMTAFV